MAKPVAFYAALNPGDEPARSEAETDAQRRGGYSHYAAFNQKIPGMGGKTAEAGWFVYEAQSQPTSPAQSPSPSRQTPTQPAGSGGSRSGAQALQATMANQPQVSGGGQGYSISATQVGVTLPQRSDEFLGIDSLTPDNKLNVNHAPRGYNWDPFRRIGSRCVRAGVAKMSEDRDTVQTSVPAAISSEYRGLAICPLPASGAQDDKLIFVFHDKDADIGVASGAGSQTSFHIVTGDPRWGRPRDLTGVPGPSVTLSDQGSQVMRVNAVYTNVFPAARAELMEQTVKAIIIRYVGPVSGATPRHPLDPDGSLTDGSDDGTESTSFKTRSQAWDGSSTNFDTSALAAGKYWVSVWGVSLEGVSEPTERSITIA